MAYDRSIRYVTPEQVADTLRMNVNTVYAALRRHEIPHIMVGRYYKVPVEFLGIHPPKPILSRRGVGQLTLPLEWW